MYTVKLLQSSSLYTKKTMMKEFGMKEEVVYFLMLHCVCVCVYIYVCVCLCVREREICTVFDGPTYGPYPFRY